MKPRDKHPSRVVEIPIVEVKPDVLEVKEMSKKEARKKVGVLVIETIFQMSRCFGIFQVNELILSYFDKFR